VHLYHANALRELPDLELVGIADPSPSDATRELARRASAVLTPDANALFGAVDVDAVLISSPHALHGAHVETALHARKHVLVDKPFVLTSRDATHLARLARSQGRVGAVAFNRRLDPAYRRARTCLEEGLLGAIRHVDSIQLGYPTSGWVAEDPELAGGGPFLGRGAHLADAVPWLLGDDPRMIRAWVEPPRAAGAVDRGGYWDVDLGCATWRATILADGPDLYDEVRVFGDLGWLALRRSAPLAWPPPSGLRGLPGWELSTHERAYDPGLPAESALADFRAAIAAEREPACRFEEAVGSVRLVEAAYASTASGNVAVELGNARPKEEPAR
jgi:predicted dehydrogenase